MASIFDILGPRDEEQGGLSGLAVALRGRGPRGFREALGAGVLGASETAESTIPSLLEAAPQAETAGQAFGGLLGAGLLASLGRPARGAAARATAREQEEAAFRQSVLAQGFNDLTPEAKERVFSAVGFSGLDFQKDTTESAKAVAREMAKTVSDPEAPEVDRKNAASILGSMDPALGKIFDRVKFPEGVAKKLTPAWINALSGFATEDSMVEYLQTDGDISVLIPKDEKTRQGRSLTPGQLRDQQALNDFANITFTAETQGRPKDEVAAEYFAGNALGASNLARFMGQAAGTASLSSGGVALSLVQMGINASIQKMLIGEDVSPAFAQDLVSNSFRVADAFTEEARGRGIPVTDPGPRQPGGGTGVAPAARTTPPNLNSPSSQELLRALREIGIDTTEITTGDILIAKFNELQEKNPEAARLIKQRLAEARAQPR